MPIISHKELKTHLQERGDNPFFPYYEMNVSNILSCLNARSSDSVIKTIVNIDIDYFTYTEFEQAIEIFSRDYIRALGRMLKEGIEEDWILVVTVALSPEWSGGWKLAEEIAGHLLDAVGYEFKLPAEAI